MQQNDLFIYKVLNVTLGVIIGILLGYFIYNSKFIQFDFSVNVVELGNLVVTIIVVILIHVIYQRQKDNLLKAKDLYLKRLEEITETLDIILDLAQQGKVKLTVINCKIKLLLVSYTHLMKILSHKHTKLNYCEGILNELKEVKVLLTNTPIGDDSSRVTLLSVTDNVLKIHPDRIRDIENKISEVKKQILDLSIAIIDL